MDFLDEFRHFILRDCRRGLRSQSLLLGGLLSKLFPEECIGGASLALTFNKSFSLNLVLKFERMHMMVFFIGGWAVQN